MAYANVVGTDVYAVFSGTKLICCTEDIDLAKQEAKDASKKYKNKEKKVSIKCPKTAQAMSEIGQDCIDFAKALETSAMLSKSLMHEMKAERYFKLGRKLKAKALNQDPERRDG